tara:strand:- start:1580 stop:3040 length:1461 start_codon:yes stop_codon:yes gene_type:complete
LNWPELSIDDFPPRRDDEPSSLRQDIIDELSDHFACALNRELLKNPDEQLAKQRVLNQFGDPIKIARQLWLDAMKEKIMSQRIMTGVSVTMAVCGFIVVGMVWSMMKDSQAFNTRMMAQMTEIANRRVSEVQTESAAVEMNQVSFQLVQGKEDGRPGGGFAGKLTKIGDNTDSFTLKEESNAEGKLDFGKLPWGVYSLNVIAPWGETYHNDLTVLPGRNFSQTIVCPSAAPVEVPVRFEVEWPDDLKSDDWLLLCDFRPRPIDSGLSALSRKIGAELWTRPYPNPLDGTWDYSMACLINQKNQVFRCPLDQNRRFQNIDIGKLEARQTINMIEGDQYLLPVMYLLYRQDLADLQLDNPNVEESSVSFMVLNHSRESLRLISPANLNLQNAAIFGGPNNVDATTLIVTHRKIGALNAAVREENKGTQNVSGRPFAYSSGIQFRKLLKFTAAKDQDNVWKIKLPELEQLKIPEGTKQVEANGSGGGFF